MKKTIFKVLMLSAVLFFASCSKDEPQAPKGAYENGILVSGEGSGAGSGSVSYVSNDLKTSENKIYNKVNKADLGTFLQSLAFKDDRAFIIVDNQNTITVVNRYTFEKVGTIATKLVKPRYMAVVGDKGYITNWGKGKYLDNIDDDFVAVVNLKTLQVEKTIKVAVGPERIVANNGKLFVSHKGAFGINNKVSVINASTNKVEKVIEVKERPDELVFDNQGNLLVLCEGNKYGKPATEASISKIKLSDYSVSEVVFPKGSYPSLMVLDNKTLYYNIGAKAYKMNVTDKNLPNSEFLTIELFKDKKKGYVSFYGMAVKNGKFFALNTSFKDISELQVFNLSDKKKVKTFEAPIGASKIYFN